MVPASKAKLKILVVSVLAFAAGAVPREAQALDLQCGLMPQLFENYFQFHLTQKKLDEEIKTHTVEQYIKRLDPSKTLFLAGDVAQLRADLRATFDTMKKGDCSLLGDVRALTIKRAEENEAYVKKFVTKTYKVDKDATLILDPKKRDYPADQAAKEDILRRMVHFQMENYLLSATKMDEARKLLIHRYELMHKRLKERDQQDMINDFADSFALALDPHSDYMAPDNLKDFQIQMQLSLEGIGATLTSTDGFTVIESLIPGGGAERSQKLRPKDRILAVAQDGKPPVSVIDMDLSDVVKMIRGKKGTKVTLNILRQSEGNRTFDVTIVRDKIDVKDQAASIRYETRQVGDRKLKVGILELPSFYGGGDDGTRSSFVDVRNLLEEAKREKVDGIVLDLSRNGGGLLDHAVKISGLFVKQGGMVATKDNRGRVQVLADDDDDVVYAGPLVILISRLSASASEILAGTLQSYHRALIVGSDHTFGKGSVQSVIDLPHGLGAMKVTVGLFFVASGKTTQHDGVSSDVAFPSVFGSDDIGEKVLDYSLEPQTIPPFISPDANGTAPGERWKPIEPAVVKALAQKSAARVEKSPEFAKIKSDLADAENQDVIKIADLGKKNNGKKNGEEKSAKEAVNELVAPMVNESVAILVDYVVMP